MANTVDITLRLKQQGDAIAETNKELKTMEKRLNDVEKDAKKTDKALTNVGSGAKANFSGLATAITAAGVALGGLTTALIANNKELQQQATLSGLSVEEFQEFATAAKFAGATADQTADAINDLSLKINEALVLGSGAAVDVFKNLGLSLEEVAKLSPTEQFEALAKALGGVDEQQRKLFLDEIASDALIQLTPLIESYDELTAKAREFGESGGFLTEKDLQNTRELTQAFTLLGTQLQTSGTKGLGVFSDELTPVVEDLIGKLQELTKVAENGFSEIEIFATRIAGAVKIVFGSIVAFVNGLQSAFNLAVNGIRGLGQSIDAILDGDFERLGEIEFFDSAQIRKDGEEILAALTDVKEGFGSLAFPQVQLVNNQIRSIKEELNKLAETGDLTIAEDIEKELEEARTRIDSLEADDLIAPDLASQFRKQINALTKTFNDEVNTKTDGFKIDIKVSQPANVVDISKLNNEIAAAERQLQILKIKAQIGDENGGIGFEEFQAQAEAQLTIISDNLSKLISVTPDGQPLDEYNLKLAQVNKQFLDLKNQVDPAEQALNQFNKTLLEGEIELLELQGNVEAANNAKLNAKLQEIEANKTLTEEQKNQLVQQQLQIDATNQAIVRIEDLKAKIEELPDPKITAFDVEDEASGERNSLVEEIRRIEEAYGLATTASDEFANQDIENAKRQQEARDELAKDIANEFSDSFFSIIDGTKTVEEAFREMLANILKALIQSQIEDFFTSLFSNIGGGIGGGGFGGLGSFFGSFFHTGGIVGKDGFNKHFSIPKYHTGGIAGLAPDEVPAVLQRGEEVLTADDPRHRNNAGNSGIGQTVQINNLLNTDEIANALNGNQSFGDAITNYITANKNEFNSIINS